MASEARSAPHLKVLDDLLSLGRAVLAEIEYSKPDEGLHAWVFALLARLTSSGLAARALIRAGHTWDAKIIGRAMLDSLIDMAYILHDPSKRAHLIELFRLESIVDQHSILTFHAALQHKSPRQLARTDTRAQQIIHNYRQALKHPAFQSRGPKVPKGRKPQWPRRWKDIGRNEKQKALEEYADAMRLMQFPVRELGNAAAHARPVVLEELLQKRPDGSSHFLVRPRARSSLLFSRDVLALEACTVLHIAYEYVIRQFRLSAALEGRAQELFAHLERLSLRAKRCVSRPSVGSTAQSPSPTPARHSWR